MSVIHIWRPRPGEPYRVEVDGRRVPGTWPDQVAALRAAWAARGPNPECASSLDRGQEDQIPNVRRASDVDGGTGPQMCVEP